MTPEQIAEIVEVSVAAQGDVEALFGSIGCYVSAFARGAATRAVKVALAEYEPPQFAQELRVGDTGE